MPACEMQYLPFYQNVIVHSAELMAVHSQKGFSGDSILQIESPEQPTFIMMQQTGFAKTALFMPASWCHKGLPGVLCVIN
jgi:hypothetical protein